MLNFTVKTLNAEDHQFQMDSESSVRQLKEAISSRLNIPSDRQRLIFQGRVLHDDRVLRECGVDNKVIHLVESLLPNRRSAQSESATQRGGSSQVGQQRPMGATNSTQAGRNVMIGAFAVPVTNLNPEQIMAMIRRVLNNMGEIGRSAQIHQQTMPDGSLEYRIQMRNDHNSEINGPALARIQHIRHLLGDVDHMLYHLDERFDDSSEVAVTQLENHATNAGDPPRDPIDSPPLFESNDPCQGHAGNQPHTEPTANDQMRISTLSDLMGEAIRIQDRLRPHLDRYRRHLSEDEDFRQTGAVQRAQNVSRLFSRIQNVLHNLSHMYHAMSDLSVHFCESPPRNLYPRLELSQQQRQPSEIEVTLTVQTGSVPVNMNNQPANGAGRAGGVGLNIRPPTANMPPGMNFGGVQMMPGFPPFRMPVGPFMGGPFPPPGMSMPMAVPMAVPMPTTTPSGGFAWRQVEPGTFSVTSVSVNDEAGQPGNSTPASINPEQFNAMAQGAAANVFQQLMQGIAAATGNMMGGAAASLGRSVPNLTTAASNPNAPEQLSTSNSASNLLDVDTGTQNHTAHSHPSEPRSRSSDSRLPRARRPAASPSPGRPAIFAPQRSRNQPGRIQFAAQPIRPGAGHPTGPPPLFVGPHPPSEIPLYTLDPFLPCSSRFFASQLEAITHRRPSEPQRQQASPGQPEVSAASTDDSATNQNDTEVINARFAQQFESIMRSVMQDMISLPTPGTVNMNGPHPSMFQFNLVTMPPQTISVEMPIQMEIRTPTAPPPTRATPQQASPTNNQARPTGNTQVDTASLIAGVVSSMAQGSDQSLAQFLQGLGETVDMENEGLMGEIFHLVSTQLSFRDITAIFAGNYNSLNRLRPHLIQFLSEKFYGGNRHPSRDEISHSARQIVVDNEASTREYVSGVTAVAGVDILRTILASERCFMDDLLTLIFNEPHENESFGRIFYERLISGVEKNLAVVIHSNVDGRVGAQRVLQNILRRQMDGIPAEFQGMLTQAGLGHFQRLIDRAAISSEELAQLTVSIDDPPDDGPINPVASSSATVNNEQSVPKAETSVSSDSGDEFMDVSETPHEETPHVVDSNAWHQNVPAQWIEVIEADIVLQQNLPPQPPFSDAYMFGMPSKRRKVLTERKPKWSRSSNETFRENLRDAVSEAGVQPITGESAADVVAAAQLDPVLLESYEAEMKAKVAKRIRSDPDFDPQKYPNAAAYFK